MFRRILLSTALVLSAVPVWAQTRATYVLSNGEKHYGVIVNGRGDNNLVDGKFHVNESGVERVFERNDVVVIDFVGGTPNAAERNAVADPGVMVMRDGTTKRGTLHDIRFGDVVQWVDEGGTRNDYPSATVRRLYLNPGVARSVYLNSTSNSSTSGSVATTGRNGTTSVRVAGNDQWVDSGVSVRRGDRIQFNSNGSIRISPGTAITPAGARQSNPNYPAPSANVGSLIAKIDDGAPFQVGGGNREIVMNADGRLMLGVNDDDVSDNSGEFMVTLRRR